VSTLKSEVKAMKPDERRARIDLGLAISATYAKRGEPLTRKFIAAFCDCTESNIASIEQEALKKLYRRIAYTGTSDIKELAQLFRSEFR
jgi:hypothetical protein